MPENNYDSTSIILLHCLSGLNLPQESCTDLLSVLIQTMESKSCKKGGPSRRSNVAISDVTKNCRVLAHEETLEKKISVNILMWLNS